MARTWTVDNSHSHIGFSVRHMMFTKVRGSFGEFEVELVLDESNLERSSVKASIGVASIDTGNAQRDGHLKSPDFFDVEKHPTMTFRSTRVETIDAERFDVVGELTILDTTREVTLEVSRMGSGTDPWGNHRAGFSARLTIEREDFGLTWNQALETGGVLVGKKVNIELEVQAIGKEISAPLPADAATELRV